MDVMEHCLPSGYLLQGSRHSFRLERVLGKGGFGITYQGQETVSGIQVAVKEYFPNVCKPCRMPDGAIAPLSQYQRAYEQGKKSFLNEAAMLKALDEIPSVVRILDFFSANGTAYMVMEYLNGTTLRKLVERDGPIPIRTLLPRLLPLMNDISAMHQRGVLHRDIAPDNIMWMPDNSMKLLDFGCARAMEDGRSMTVQLKPGFAPLEQYQTRGQGDYTDLYALCATIYYCITGLVPPSAPERIFALNDNQADPLPHPSALGVHVSSDLENLLMWGLAVDPNQRPQTVEQWSARIQALVPAPTIADASAKKLPFSARERLLIGLGCALGIVIVILLICLL